MGGTCWDEPWHPVVMTRDPDCYDAIAEVLDEHAPPGWTRVTASVVISGKGRKACTVGPLCGSTVPPDDDCLNAVHAAIMTLGGRCLAPRGMAWMGIWIEHDFRTGRMVARMMHGGKAKSDATPDLVIPHADAGGASSMHGMTAS